MFLKHGVPAAQIGEAFELQPEEKILIPTPKEEKKEENDVISEKR